MNIKHKEDEEKDLAEEKLSFKEVLKSSGKSFGNSYEAVNNLINNLLGICEANNLLEVYRKYLVKKKGISPIDDFSKFNSYFTKSNINRDIKKMDGILKGRIYEEVISVLEECDTSKPIGLKYKRILRKRRSILDSIRDKEINGIECLFLVDKIGDILNIYYKAGYLPKKIKLNDLATKLFIEESKKEMFIRELERIAKEGRISAIIRENTLEFIPKFLHPINRILLIELIITITIGTSLAILMFSIIKNIFK
ncbi:MAG: hypothetical protein ACTSRZ_20075 [Promethearchaeota archaeon]